MTDDFEADLRRRLADLAASADHDQPWDDPLPAARAAAPPAGDGPADEPATVVPLQRPARPRRWLPSAAVAAVVLAVVTGGAFGLRALADGSGASSGSADVAAAGSEAASAGVTAPGRAAPGGGGLPGTSSLPQPDGGTDPGGCQVLAAATSTGPLAQVATVRSSGVVAPRTTPGGAAGITYQLTFGQAGGTADVRAATALLVRDGSLCASTGTAQPGVIQAVPVAPGPGQSGSVTFGAVDSDGAPLPAGDYQVAVVIPYSVDGSPAALLVSPPVAVTVSAS